MGEIVGNEKVNKEKGYVYYVGKDGYVYASPMKYTKKKEPPKKLTKNPVKREPGYLYFVGKSGYVERVPVRRKK
jgi:hypothetical protein